LIEALINNTTYQVNRKLKMTRKAQTSDERPIVFMAGGKLINAILATQGVQ